MYCWLKKIGFIIFLGCSLALKTASQRVYKPASVLASGNWYKIGTIKEGIYKIDISFLGKLGINGTGIASKSVRVFGNGGNMLPEANSEIRIDDLEENPLLIMDGGDGILNTSDYILFFAPGPHRWIKDSANKKFYHEKNIFSDSSYYFLTIGGTGKHIDSFAAPSLPNQFVNTFNERYFHELDSVNLLSSGKEWFGEEFTNAPGKTLSRNFSIPVPGLQVNQPLFLITNCIARSVGTPSRFDIRINNQLVQQLVIPQASAGIYDLFAQQVQQTTTTVSTQENILLNYTYIPGGFNSQAWLNWFEIHARKDLLLSNNKQLLFRDWNSVGNNIAEFVISNASNGTQVWEITNPLSPIKMRGSLSGTSFRFTNDCNRLKEYLAFNPSDAFIPVPLGRVANQDLHNSVPADYLIITHNSFLAQAERLATFHMQKNNLKVFVTTTEKIFNEFSSGTPDATAVRDFIKMYYDKAAANPAQKPRYVLLLGDASFDYQDRINPNTNLVPAFESKTSLDPLNTYTSDDYFGFLDDNEDINSGIVTNLVDVGIGRVPAKNITEAKNYIDKVEAYYSKESFGPWRTHLSFVADDEDNNLHLQDAEVVTATSATSNPVFNLQKIYLDAYLQQSGPAGSRYPQVNEIINNRIYNGTLIFNYNGHGGSKRLAEEVILDQQMVNGWKNPNRLPLFVTSTCDFAPYDDPFNSSLGEDILLRPRSGGIALMTTTRLVFSFSNRVMNNNYMQFALQPDTAGKYKSLGEAVLAAKNYTYQTSGDFANNRKFTLLGDPALTLGFPRLKIRTTTINDFPVSAKTDTISAGEKAVIEGEVTDNNGVLLSSFRGTLYPVVFDKPRLINTLGNDPTSQPAGFQSQANAIFKGKASVVDGKFRFEFITPKDLNYQFGNGRISYYAEDGNTDGGDLFTGFIVGGSGPSDNDREGPVIKAWMNDEKFVNGSITNEAPILILKLFDSSGINIAGTGIGHDISVTIDDDNNQFYILNDYYEADQDNYRQGNLRFQLPVLEPGLHTIKIRVWDVLNNSSEAILDFSVVNDEALIIDHVLNYPNPFTTKTQFWFEHNKPGQDLHVQIHIYTVTGRIIKTIQKTINTPGNRSSELEWDGRDERGDKVGRGVYFYRVKIQCTGMKSRTVFEKLVVF